MWSDEEISRILEIFPEALNSDTLVPRPTDRPLFANFGKFGGHNKHTNVDTSPNHKKRGQNIKLTSTSLVDPIWETLDPTPDVRAMFAQFDSAYFDGKLAAVEVRWSSRMTLCAGLCCYEGRGGLCSIRLSEPLLKLRPRSDLVETLLHEMIHAFLFVTQRDKDRESHGPNFRYHMKRINSQAGTNITVFHTFHREVENYQKHWWRCTGRCRDRPPFFGYVKRAINRAPGPNDTWWGQHQATCEGHFIKIMEPDKVSISRKKRLSNAGLREASGSCDVQKRKKGVSDSTGKANGDIREFFQKPSVCIPSCSRNDCGDAYHLNELTEFNIDWASSPSVHQLLGVRQVPDGECQLVRSNSSQLAGKLKCSMEDDTATNFSSIDDVPDTSSAPFSTEELAACPVCTVLVPVSQINEHLDVCLT